MSQTPRVPAVDPAQAPDFSAVMAHTPDILASFFDLYAQFWQAGTVNAQFKEIARLRNARITDCGY